jgi:hypothetical protein
VWVRVFRDEFGDVPLNLKKNPPRMEKNSPRLEKQSNFRRCITAEKKLVLKIR